jgi:signal transduction histidine kinase
MYVNIVIFSSLVILGVMVVSVTHDEFRLVWFLLLSFASFMLGGKRYGVMISLWIAVIVYGLFWTRDIHLSGYAVATFGMGLLTFNIFLHHILDKIHNDAAFLHTLVEKEVQKRQTQEQILLRNYRMTNMGEMIDAIAHQWRQPLAQGSMILLNMQEELENPCYLQEKITQLSTLNQHMSQTIDDFRRLLHEEKHKSTFDLHSATDAVLKLMKNQLHDIALEYSNRVDRPVVGYKNELIQVLIILFSNAIQALNISGISHKKIALILEQKDAKIFVHIEDNAGGINPSVKERLFDPYITTKKSSGGTGLGLYIARIIVEDTMQGKLSVSEGLKGARFTIEIKGE